jgi:hypothetical protein
MKAIKLASVFAVTTVAAAVSTATFAADAVFKGTAGLEYKSYLDDASTKADAAGTNGEVNIVGDTGVVYFKLDMEGSTVKSNGTPQDTKSNTALNLDAIYVKQGAVKFGDFDGSLVDAAALSAGVREDNDDAKYDLGDDLGIRYAVNDSLTVAVEVAEGGNKGTLSASYKMDLAGGTLAVSGGYKSVKNVDNQILTVGFSAPLGMATLSTFIQAGSKADLDVMNTGVGLDLAVTEQVSLAAQYYTEAGEASKGVDKVDAGVMELTAYYQAGDIQYYASYIGYEGNNDVNNYSVVGAEVSF